MKRTWKYFFAVVCLCFSALVVRAFPAHFTKLPPNSLSNSINALAQDDEGFIWIGTSAGLLQYDGYSYRDFKQFDALPVSNGRIRCIMPDPDGRIWIGTDAGALVYDPGNGRFTRIAGPTDGNPIKAIARTGHGDYLLSTVEGIDIIDSKTLESHFHPADSDHPFFHNCRRIAADASGNIWTGYANTLVKFDFSSSRFKPEPKFWEAKEKIRVFSIDGNNVLFFLAAGDDLFCCSLPDDDGEPLDSSPRKLLNDVDVRDVIPAQDGTVTVVTSYNGILRFNIGEEQEDRLPPVQEFWLDNADHTDIANAVLCALMEKGGSLFYGTADGLFAEWASSNRNFRSIPGGGLGNLLHNVVSDVHSEDGRTIWIASNKGIDELLYDGSAYSIEHHVMPSSLFPKVSDMRLQCIQPDGNGNIWLGTKGGVLAYDIRSGRFCDVPVLSSCLASFGASFCKSISMDASGNIWLGFIYGGLFEYDPGRNKCTKIKLQDQDMSSANVYNVMCDMDGCIWVATNGRGLYSFDRSDCSPDGDVFRYKSWFHNSGVIIYDVMQTSKGVVVACTSQGIYRIPAGTGEVPDQILDMKVPFNKAVEDRDGNLWISSSSGLLYVDSSLSESIFFELNESSFSRPDYNNGACLAFDGTLFYGGINGVTYFKPREVVSVAEHLRPHISGALVMGKPIPVQEDGHFDLRHNDYHFSLTLSTLSFPVDISQKYYYRVKEHGDSWIPMESNVLSFANLTPGQYHISFTCDPGDVFGVDELQSVVVDVAYPFWRKWWAYCIYVIVFTLIAFSIISILLSRYRSEYQMRTFLNVTHGLKTPLSLMKVPVKILKSGSKDAGLLDMIDRNADKLSNTVNQLLELRKIDRKRPFMHLCSIDLKDFTEKIVALFAPMFASKGVKLSGRYPGGTCQFVCDPDKIELILFNLLQNAYRFTNPGGEVSVVLSSTTRDVALSVSDTGVGIDKKYHSKMFERFWQYRENGALPSSGSGIGLSVVKEFVSLHGGKVSVESAVGMGATFNITLPRKKYRLAQGAAIQQVEPDYTRRYAGSVQAAEPEVAEAESGHSAVVVSGEPDMVDLLKTVLRGFKIDSTDNLEDAFKMVCASHPQIVLVNLDDKNREASLDLCRKLKKDFSTSDIPVVYITNDDSPQEARLYYEIGADSHISKPFDPDLLKARIDQLVNKHLNIREKIKVEKILSSDQELQIESADEKFLREAMDVVEANIPNEDFNLDVFSASMHSSKSLLSSRIRSITGRSPMELVRNARMIRAAQLLATGAYDVTQVCYMVGFSDPRYFATCFKKEYSCTPSSYITSNKSQ